MNKENTAEDNIYFGEGCFRFFFFFPFYEGLLLYSHKEVNEVLHRAKTIPT